MTSHNFLKIKYHGFNRRVKSEINITPFIDVMLVLLIVFMLTSHIANNGAEIDLPQSSVTFIPKEDYINIIVDKYSNIYIQEIIVKRSEFISKINTILTHKPQIPILIYGDRSAYYGDIMYIFSALKDAAINNVTLATEE